MDILNNALYNTSQACERTSPQSRLVDQPRASELRGARGDFSGGARHRNDDYRNKTSALSRKSCWLWPLLQSRRLATKHLETTLQLRTSPRYEIHQVDRLNLYSTVLLSTSMSLYEVWQAAAGSAFQPTVGKESQLNVGLFLLLIGLIFTGLFALNKSPLSIPIFGIPASLAFGFGAVYAICGFGVYV
ncbi:uncharacterized protein Z519_12588 [Cladophialophora bantiana CBS 173.52]|uniref:Dolichyl-diphosphooligosaccharide-protein glycosyltransferase subunit OST5 n=1 Tax=Cladophialophora bantiana (strain ATCC 10958 / CBS 173.52 / CDC B-1940 / NIH 8579) TaxID=1442370 RepID=A0A0D2FJC6_CLAB1|nr:uncharacterized protein Z519_12588 [Cladophialophora bantiana CBS 173.52]KIW86802.1 hypothetical protein Z519_12588 [Cladophialophora bantiana CBS 173.52]